MNPKTKQRQKYRAKELTRTELVERNLARGRRQFVGDHDRTGFIGEVWFSSFEKPRLLPPRHFSKVQILTFCWNYEDWLKKWKSQVKSKYNRLDWFVKGKGSPGLRVEEAEMLNESDSIETINQINSNYIGKELTLL